MIYLIGALIIMAGIIVLLFKSNRKKKSEIGVLLNHVEVFQDTLIKRNKQIQALEDINHETTEKKKKIHTDNDSDNFDNSLDILSELSADPD